MCVFSPNSQVEILTLKEVVLGGWGLWDEISVLIEEAQESSLAPCRVRLQ